MDQHSSKKVGVGLIGSQFISTIHAEAFKWVHDAKIVAAISPNEEHVSKFCETHHIPKYFTKLEIHGSEGVAYADVLQGNSIQTYSTKGVGYAVEKAGNTIGWSYTMYEEIWNYGFPQELAHFVDCVKNDKQPLVTGEDGKAVLEVIYAAYESAGTGKKVSLPFRTDAEKPIRLWKK
jgi:myo-inositol 2-dehydrogenase/D-chiro-inositol 1-dehydrogenase